MLWDAIAVTKAQGDADSSSTSTVADAAKQEVVAGPHGHHTIPVYLCGGINQIPLADLTVAQHVAVHAEIGSIWLVVTAAEEYAYKILGRHRLPEVLKIAQTEPGRASIANALNAVYQAGWWGMGAPNSIGTAFTANKGDYVSGINTSLPWCCRNNAPK